jgi:ATP-dependent protease ClpP protease subunit
MTGHVFVYGEIGTGPGQVSQKFVKSQIDKNSEKYVVHIFSPGGDVFEGYGIYNAIKNDTNGKPVEVHIEGLCASIATLIAASGQKIVMNKTGQFMIHNPHISDLKGDADKLRSVANQLDQIKSILINVYKQRTGLSDEKLWELYDNETYLTADEAVKMGFIDESVDAIKAVAKLDLNNFKMEKKKESLLSKFLNLLNTVRNAVEEALADGRVIIVDSDDDNWTGKRVVLADGAQLEDGQHAMASGKVITVSGGTITEVSEGEAPADKNDEEMNNKIKELETALAEARAAKETAEAAANAAKTEATQATAKAAKFENRVTMIESEFLKLKEHLGQTVGDTTEDAKGPGFKNVGKDQQSDPMGDFALQFYKNRNLIK